MSRIRISSSEDERAPLDAEASRNDDLAALDAAVGAWDRDSSDGAVWVERRRPAYGGRTDLERYEAAVC